MNNRRKLIIALGVGALSASFGSFAQKQGKIWRVGFLSQRHIDFLDSDYYFGAFRKGMGELGYIDGKNLAIEWRSAEGMNERLPSLASELSNLNLDVIVTPGTPATAAVQKATSTTPIVMVGAGDPVGTGLITSLAKPGGNTTGLSNLSGDIGSKRLEMLLSIVPNLSRVAVLVNPNNASVMRNLDKVLAEGQRHGVNILSIEARTVQEIENAFSLIRQKKAGALIVSLDPLLQQQKNQIAELAMKYRLPAIAGGRIYAEAGILMSYGVNYTEQYLRAATYVDKILKGAKPADLPVEQPTLFEFIVNGKTAKALGLKIPKSLLIMADKVIE